MKTAIHMLVWTAAFIALTSLAACGGSGDAADESDGNGSSETSSSAETSTPAETASEAPPADEEADKGLTVQDDTAEAALRTYLEGIKQGQLEVAIAVLVPDAPGTEKLYQMKEGWDMAAAEGAPVAMAQAVLAGEIRALSYEKISDDGAFATFRFSKPTAEATWDIQAIKTPEGWRITPPDSGLPQN